MSLLDLRDRNARVWRKIKVSWFYGGLVLSLVCFVSAVIGFLVPDSESSYINEYASLVVSLVGGTVAYILRNEIGKNT